jgi:hypothetical protein
VGARFPLNVAPLSRAVSANAGHAHEIADLDAVENEAAAKLARALGEGELCTAKASRAARRRPPRCKA